MDMKQAKKLDLQDQQAELLDRLFHLHHGYCHYTILTAAQRSNTLENFRNWRPKFAHAEEDYELAKHWLEKIIDEWQRLAWGE